MKKILITGIYGFIGKIINENLISTVNDIWGIDRASYSKNIFSLDLLNRNQCKILTNKLPDFDVIIHTAAIAHDKLNNRSVYEQNLEMTKNVLFFFSKPNTHFIFLSSVSVYGEDKRFFPISVNDSTRPSSYYGKSKKKCEEIISETLINFDILRLSPVYDKDHLYDIKKRVFFPMQSYFKMQIIPSPKYSLCNSDLIAFNVNQIIDRGPQKQNIFNISDKIIYNQNDISNAFPNNKIILPELLFRPIYYLTFLFGKSKGYTLRCLYWKLFKSNVYLCNFENDQYDFKKSLFNIITHN